MNKSESNIFPSIIVLFNILVIISLTILSACINQHSKSPQILNITEIHSFPLSSEANEGVWRDELSKELNGKTEQNVPFGRIDVLTDTQAIELDWVHKWHEGIGQALHYSLETQKQPTLALISLSTNDMSKINYIQTICDKLNIKLIILKQTE